MNFRLPQSVAAALSLGFALIAGPTWAEQNSPQESQVVKEPRTVIDQLNFVGATYQQLVKQNNLAAVFALNLINRQLERQERTGGRENLNVEQIRAATDSYRVTLEALDNSENFKRYKIESAGGVGMNDPEVAALVGKIPSWSSLAGAKALKGIASDALKKQLERVAFDHGPASAAVQALIDAGVDPVDISKQLAQLGSDYAQEYRDQILLQTADVELGTHADKTSMLASGKMDKSLHGQLARFWEFSNSAKGEDHFKSVQLDGLTSGLGLPSVFANAATLNAAAPDWAQMNLLGKLETKLGNTAKLTQQVASELTDLRKSVQLLVAQSLNTKHAVERELEAALRNNTGGRNNEHIQTLSQRYQQLDQQENFKRTKGQIAAFRSTGLFLGQLLSVVDKGAKTGRHVQAVVICSTDIWNLLLVNSAAGLAGGPFGLAAGIAASVFQLVGNFLDQGPPPEQAILDQISALRDDIAALKTQMHQRFDGIDAKLDQLLVDSARILDAIGRVRGDVALFRLEMETGLSKLTQHILNLEARMVRADIQSAEDRLRRLTARCSSRPGETFSLSEFQDCLVDLGACVSSHKSFDRAYPKAAHNSEFFDLAFHQAFVGEPLSVAAPQPTEARRVLSDEVYAQLVSLEESQARGAALGNLSPRSRAQRLTADLAVLSKFHQALDREANSSGRPGEYRISAADRQPQAMSPTVWLTCANRAAQLYFDHPEYVEQVPSLVQESLQTILRSGETLDSALGALTQKLGTKGRHTPNLELFSRLIEEYGLLLNTFRDELVASEKAAFSTLFNEKGVEIRERYLKDDKLVVPEEAPANPQHDFVRFFENGRVDEIPPCGGELAVASSVGGPIHPEKSADFPRLKLSGEAAQKLSAEAQALLRDRFSKIISEHLPSGALALQELASAHYHTRDLSVSLCYDEFDYYDQRLDRPERKDEFDHELNDAVVERREYRNGEKAPDRLVQHYHVRIPPSLWKDYAALLAHQQVLIYLSPWADPEGGVFNRHAPLDLLDYESRRRDKTLGFNLANVASSGVPFFVGGVELGKDPAALLSEYQKKAQDYLRELEDLVGRKNFPSEWRKALNDPRLLKMEVYNVGGPTWTDHLVWFGKPYVVIRAEMTIAKPLLQEVAEADQNAGKLNPVSGKVERKVIFPASSHLTPEMQRWIALDPKRGADQEKLLREKTRFTLGRFVLRGQTSRRFRDSVSVEFPGPNAEKVIGFIDPNAQGAGSEGVNRQGGFDGGSRYSTDLEFAWNSGELLADFLENYGSATSEAAATRTRQSYGILGALDPTGIVTEFTGGRADSRALAIQFGGPLGKGVAYRAQAQARSKASEWSESARAKVVKQTRGIAQEFLDRIDYQVSLSVLSKFSAAKAELDDMALRTRAVAGFQQLYDNALFFALPHSYAQLPALNDHGAVYRPSVEKFTVDLETVVNDGKSARSLYSSAAAPFFASAQELLSGQRKQVEDLITDRSRVLELMDSTFEHTQSGSTEEFTNGVVYENFEKVESLFPLPLVRNLRLAEKEVTTRFLVHQVSEEYERMAQAVRQYVASPRE